MTLSRRNALSLFATSLACPACLGVARAETGHPAAGGPPHWDYHGEAGPERWGTLAPEFRVCSLGLEQTPVDLRAAVPAAIGSLSVALARTAQQVLNNGHTIQVNCAPGARTEILGTQYDLLQFHFHHPSEHLLAGRGFDLECHFVHRSAAGALAVLGVFIQPGAENKALQPIWQAMPASAGPARALDSAIDPALLLPEQRQYFRYAGSLTTPPCSEGVLWTLFKTPVEASAEQIRRFAQLFPVNARPPQAVNRRFVLESI